MRGQGFETAVDERDGCMFIVMLIVVFALGGAIALGSNYLYNHYSIGVKEK